MQKAESRKKSRGCRVDVRRIDRDLQGHRWMDERRQGKGTTSKLVARQSGGKPPHSQIGVRQRARRTGWCGVKAGSATRKANGKSWRDEGIRLRMERREAHDPSR